MGANQDLALLLFQQHAIVAQRIDELHTADNAVRAAVKVVDGIKQQLGAALLATRKESLVFVVNGGSHTVRVSKMPVTGEIDVTVTAVEALTT